MWDRLAVLYHQALCRQARLILPSSQDPENAVGDVWLRALKAAGGFDPERDPFPWLARICVNTCLNQRRGLLRRLVERLGSEPAARPAAEPPDRQAARALRRALDGLSAGQREVVALRYLFGVSVGEIGSLIRREPQAVEKRLVRALAKLRLIWPVEDARAAPVSLEERGS